MSPHRERRVHRSVQDDAHDRVEGVGGEVTGHREPEARAAAGHEVGLAGEEVGGEHPRSLRPGYLQRAKAERQVSVTDSPARTVMSPADTGSPRPKRATTSYWPGGM